MASVYTNNLRLEEIGTGEQSGTWGDTTNTNLILIGQAVAWGTRAIANASTDNITITDGALDADRCLGLKLTGGGQACTVTLLPNTSSKTWFMYNATAAALTFTCGSGANVIIPAGQTKVIATDGLGTGGVVHDLLTAVNLAGITQTAAVTTQGTLTVGVDDTGYDVKFFGATSGKSLLWDESADSLIVTGTTTLVGTTNLDAVDIDGNVQLDGTFTVGVDDTGKDVKFFGATSGKYTLWDESADTLYVSGDLATVTAGTSNFVIGVNAGDAIDANGNYNVCVGDEAGTTLTSGDHNTLVGFNSGALLLTGGENTLLGDAAGEALSVGIQNVAVGYLALTNDTKGSTSTAVGIAALASQNFTSATNSLNTAVGYEAGTTLTTGLRNVMAGHRAGVLATTPNDLIAIGFEAGGGATMTGNNNILLGTDAGHDLTSGAGNVFIGTEVGDKTDDGASNVGIGLRALGANCGSSNVAIGNSALAVTTSAENTAVGSHAGFSLTDVSGGVFVGKHSGLYATTASNSTFVGHQAGQGITGAKLTGNSNTAIGTNCGLLLQGAATENTYVGKNCGAATTTGGYNTAMGFQAFDSNTTGTYNQAFGQNALHTNSTASYNCAVGTYALATTNGAGNIAMGHYAGIYVTSGTYNVVLGYASGYSNNDGNQLTTGGSNILIGNAANVAAGGNNSTIQIGTGTGKGNGTGFITPGGGGVYQGNNASTWSQTSDRRLKKNIVDSTIGLAEINQLQVRNFEYRTEEEITELDGKIDKVEVEGVQVGVIAQEIQAILPKCVNETSQGVLSVNADNLTWHLVKSVQELSTALDAALARIATLEG